MPTLLVSGQVEERLQFIWCDNVAAHTTDDHNQRYHTTSLLVPGYLFPPSFLQPTPLSPLSRYWAMPHTPIAVYITHPSLDAAPSHCYRTIVYEKADSSHIMTSATFRALDDFDDRRDVRSSSEETTPPCHGTGGWRGELNTCHFQGREEFVYWMAESSRSDCSISVSWCFENVAGRVKSILSPAI